MGKHTTFIREIRIAVPITKAWEALAQVGDICHAHPGIKSSHLTSTQTSGVGTTRHCDFTMMGAVLDYSMKNALFDVMNVLMMKTMNAGVINGVVAGHKKYLEEGVPVVEDTPLELDKVLVVA